MYVSGTGAVAWEKAGSAYTVTGATATIAPLQMVSSVGGTGTLQTITTPASFTSSTAGCLTFLPTNTWNTTASGGNIANVITAIINVPVFACWNGTSWYMSTTPAAVAIPLVASLTTTAATSDNVTITGMTSSGHCSVDPTNASVATNVATTYVSAKTTNQVTVTHTATSGMTYGVICTSY